MNLGADRQILDVGAGTGNIGKRLKAIGIQSPIDGIDASEGMLEAAKATGCYRNCKNEFFGYGKLPEPERTGIYDVVTASGVFFRDHMPKESFSEIV